jgi:hypothetical protein
MYFFVSYKEMKRNNAVNFTFLDKWLWSYCGGFLEETYMKKRIFPSASDKNQDHHLHAYRGRSKHN